MTTNEVCKKLDMTIGQVRQLQEDLNIEGVGRGKIKHWTKLEIARMKLGKDYINYYFVADIDRYWIFYAISDGNEVMVEV